MRAPGNGVIAALLVGWGLTTVLAFWQLEMKYLRPASRPAGAAEIRPESLPSSPVAALEAASGRLALTGSGQVTLLNFWNPSCPCSRYTEAHLQRLAATYGPRGVRLVTVVECGDSASERAEALAAWKGRGLEAFAVVPDQGSSIARAFGVWAAPAAVILNTKGQVMYIGAYNAARFCNNAETAWAAQALQAVVEGRKPPRAKTLFFGCQVIPQQQRIP